MYKLIIQMYKSNILNTHQYWIRIKNTSKMDWN